MLRIIRRLLPYTSVALAVALAHLAWTGLTRRATDRRAQERAAQRVPSGAPEPYQTSDLRILHFYANTPEAVAGDQTTLCYGVLNAKAVRIVPAVEEIRPSLSRCLSVSPVRTITYTLHAEGRLGERASATFTLRVRPRRGP
jgi:hypothetical protein